MALLRPVVYEGFVETAVSFALVGPQPFVVSHVVLLSASVFVPPGLFVVVRVSPPDMIIIAYRTRYISILYIVPDRQMRYNIAILGEVKSEWFLEGGRPCQHQRHSKERSANI